MRRLLLFFFLLLLLTLPAQAAPSTAPSAVLNDEVLLLPENFQSGDEIAFRLTPCDVNGDCGAQVALTSRVSLGPLDELTPATGLLPAGTVSVTLSLTTALPADCRYAGAPNTPYAQMSENFQQGQGTTQHSTVSSGWSDLEQRAFYVRCADRNGQRNPDSDERSSQLRVLGPFAGPFPRIANLWGAYDPAYGLDFFSTYDLYVVDNWKEYGNQAALLRQRNPNAKILLSENATYGWPKEDKLTAEWWNSAPGDPGYNCLLRDTNAQILTVGYWGHPMYNLLEPACRQRLVQQSIEHYLAAKPALAYDGLYWDRLDDGISWLSAQIDSDLDGRADEPAALDAAYIAALQDFLNRVRVALPHAVLMGNDANPVYYDRWVNGRLYEWQLSSLLETGKPDWSETVDSYRNWLGRGPQPRLTFIESSPERLFEEKYTFQGLENIPPAMLAEAEAAYRNLRFGLTTALMGEGMFSFDYGPDSHGNLWWYDEFGLPLGRTAGAGELPHGYLGQPQGEPFLLLDQLSTPNLLLNGDFESGLASWGWYVNPDKGASARFSVQAGPGVSGTRGLQVDLQAPGQDYWDIEFYQRNLVLLNQAEYTLSFWARSELPRTLYVSLRRQVSPWTDYGFSGRAEVTPQWQQFHLTGLANAAAADAKLQLYFDGAAGTVWLDNVQFQQGALGVWARRYSGGLVVVNTTYHQQTLALPGYYQNLKGAQAPLYSVRQDDDEIDADPAWGQAAANARQFGQSVHTIPAGAAGAASYQLDLPYAGQYEILLWVAPAAGQAVAMPVTVFSPAETRSLTVNLADGGAPGWRSLGVYTCPVGDDCVVKLYSAASGVAVADAVKWQTLARYNDGRLVRSVTLQPQDGRVLLSISLRHWPITYR